MENRSINSEVTRLFETVVDGDYCSGCGACAAVKDSPIQMKLDEYGKFKAHLKSTISEPLLPKTVRAVCPFSGEGPNEDQIAEKLFGEDCNYHEKIGFHLATYAGYVSEDDYRSRGSSGGMGSWIVSNLFTEGWIDGVIHVHSQNPSENDPRLFHYQLSTSVDQIRNGSKSRYYPVEMSEVIQLIRNRPGRYAIVGVPCFIKAIRLLMLQDPVLAERIQFCIGLICGHLKSRYFAEMFAWQCGIEPKNLMSIDFRAKLPGESANQYGVKITGLKDGQIVEKISSIVNLYGTDWGLGFFKYKACDYCDDVLAETADVVVGDAWLPQYLHDSQGTNVIVVRHKLIHDMLEKALHAGRIHLEHISDDEVALSQFSGLKHRREGLAYRLHLASSQGIWCPPKRVAPKAKGFIYNFQKIQRMRMLLASESHLAFKDALEARDFSLFMQRMEPLVQRYRDLYKRPLWRKLGGTIRQFLKNLLEKR